MLFAILAVILGGIGYVLTYPTQRDRAGRALEGLPSVEAQSLLHVTPEGHPSGFL
jgi:hypothetical protein